MILFRELVTPDGTSLISRHRHDFVTHKDRNGKTYMLDGGINGYYYRRSANGDEKFYEITTDHDFELIRQYFERWNRYERKYVKLKDISDSWLEAILDWYICNGNQYNPIFRIFLEEKLFRAENEITVPEDSKYLEYDY